MRELTSGDIEALASGGSWRCGTAILTLGGVCLGLALVGLGYRRVLSRASCSRLEETVAAEASRALGASPTTDSILAARGAVEIAARESKLGPSSVVVVVERRAALPKASPRGYLVVVDVSAGDCHATYEHDLDLTPSAEMLAGLASRGIVERDGASSATHAHGK